MGARPGSGTWWVGSSGAAGGSAVVEVCRCVEVGRGADPALSSGEGGRSLGIARRSSGGSLAGVVLGPHAGREGDGRRTGCSRAAGSPCLRGPVGRGAVVLGVVERGFPGPGGLFPARFPRPGRGRRHRRDRPAGIRRPGAGIGLRPGRVAVGRTGSRRLPSAPNVVAMAQRGRGLGIFTAAGGRRGIGARGHSKGVFRTPGKRRYRGRGRGVLSGFGRRRGSKGWKF